MKKHSFESALKRLEEIVRDLESGERSLEESLQLFEEGMTMSGICAERLTAAKEKLQQLIRLEDGTLKILPEDDDSSEEESDQH
jgi:exodeoxyribonuclease VII small subunit